MCDETSKILKLFKEKERILFLRAYRKLYSKSIRDRKKEAEDIVQDIKLEILTHKEDYIGHKNLYLKILKRIEGKAKYRNNKTKKRYVYVENYDDLYVTESKMMEIAEKENPHSELEKKELHENIIKCGEKLGSRYKDIFFLRSLNGWGFDEISEVLELPETTVRKRAYRAYPMVLNCLRSIYGTKNISP